MVCTERWNSERCVLFKWLWFILSFLTNSHAAFWWNDTSLPCGTVKTAIPAWFRSLHTRRTARGQPPADLSICTHLDLDKMIGMIGKLQESKFPFCYTAGGKTACVSDHKPSIFVWRYRRTVKLPARHVRASYAGIKGTKRRAEGNTFPHTF